MPLLRGDIYGIFTLSLTNSNRIYLLNALKLHILKNALLFLFRTNNNAFFVFSEEFNNKARAPPFPI